MPGLEPGIFCFVGRRLIHWATRTSEAFVNRSICSRFLHWYWVCSTEAILVYDMTWKLLTWINTYLVHGWKLTSRWPSMADIAGSSPARLFSVFKRSRRDNTGQYILSIPDVTCKTRALLRGTIMNRTCGIRHKNLPGIYLTICTNNSWSY